MRTMTIIYTAALVALGAVIITGHAQAAYFGDTPLPSAFPAPWTYQAAPQMPGYTVSPYTPPPPPPMYCSRQPGGGMYCWTQ